MTGKICGTGSWAPDRVWDNNDLAKMVETSDQWIRERTGVVQRHIAKEDEDTVTMAAGAALRALEDAEMNAEEIDLILVATISPTEIMPCVACGVQERIGAENATCFDLNGACTGSLLALNTAQAYLAQGIYRNALVIGAEKLSGLTDWTDRGTCILFGDGAGAVVLRAEEGGRYAQVTHSIGKKGSALTLQSRNQIRYENDPKAKETYIQMNGKEVFSFAVSKVPEAVKELLSREQVSGEDISYYLLHQANERIIRSTELLGIEYPIIQGGMAWVADHHIAAAVSEAGGLGLIAAANAPAEWVREQIREAKKLTDKPFGVNIMLMSPSADEVAKIVVEEGIKVVTTGAGSPEKYMEAWKAAGVKVIPVVASVALARRMERCGADAVVAEGTESGGHIGETTTMALVPQVVDAVKIPVIAAGGIADGRGIAAAFMLGAEAVQMGTRFVATEECHVHENYKQFLLKARDIDTRVTGRTTGHPVRTLRNPMTKEYLEKEAAGASFEELEMLTLGGLRKAVVDGDVKTGSVMSGQIAGMVKDVPTCKELMARLIRETKEAVKKNSFLVEE